MSSSPVIPYLSTKKIDRALASFSNISRSLFVSIVGLFVNYILIHYKSNSVLNSYVYCITVVNLLFVFCNWGGKDHNIQVMAQNTSAFSETFSMLLITRLVLFVPILIPVLFLTSSIFFKCFIAFYLLLRVVGGFLESVITVQRKFHSFLLVDLILNTLLVSLLLLDRNYDNPEIFLIELTSIELLRTIISFVFFGKHFSFNIKFKKILSFLNKSRHFFYISLAGFLCLKADLYVVGLLLSSGELSHYFIVLNLVLLSQVVYHTFVSTFRAAILRYNEQSFKLFRKWANSLGFIYAIASSVTIHFFCDMYYEIKLSYLFTVLISLNVLFFTVINIQVLVYTRLNKQKHLAIIFCSSAILNIFLSFLLTHFFGITGAFTSNTLSLFFSILLFIRYKTVAVALK